MLPKKRLIHSEEISLSDIYLKIETCRANGKRAQLPMALFS